MHSITFDDNTTIDIDTLSGSYAYVGRFLRENGAGSDIFGALEKLYLHGEKIYRDGVSDRIIEDIELKLGMGSGAWDTVNPKEIVKAVIYVVLKNNVNGGL